MSQRRRSRLYSLQGLASLHIHTDSHARAMPRAMAFISRLILPQAENSTAGAPCLRHFAAKRQRRFPKCALAIDCFCRDERAELIPRQPA